MKHLLLTTIAAVLLVGCIGVQESSSPADAKLTEHVSDAKPANSEADDALVNAAVSGDIEVVKLLIANGANVNAKDVYGDSSMHYVAHRGRKEIVELILANGAEVNTTTISGDFTPLDLATKRKLADIVNLLRKHGGKTSAELKAELK